MPRHLPKYIPASVPEAPIEHKWNKTVSRSVFSEEVNERLFEAMAKSGFKANFAIGIAATEWIAYRFSKNTEATDALNRTEGAWAAAIDLSYCRDLQFLLTDKGATAKDPVTAPLEICLALLDSMHYRYSQSDVDMREPVCRQLMLAQHVLPKSADFEAWLSQSLRRLATTFPQQSDPDAETYDWWHEEVVPREFFEAGFAYTKASGQTALKAFLAGLNPAQNPFLRPAEEMNANGFSGAPYRL